jgi:hypothetical protein
MAEVMAKGAGIAGLTCALSEEFAGNMRGICRSERSPHVSQPEYDMSGRERLSSKELPCARGGERDMLRLPKLTRRTPRPVKSADASHWAHHITIRTTTWLCCNIETAGSHVSNLGKI